ncbi:hypothetical protein EB796_024270 [Bugula neritina]|uniref:Phosphatidylglycerol/phosphatidylinositol transfer protein n=1 Tax=Bugula neritina TaxID=10212 RepID=A0A7J7IU75_BUGNE|nr:hypothetical protein EB796_024270 [Bugula neritina]
MAEIAQAAWGAWLYQNQYVSIGDVFDTDCDDKERILVGKLVLLPDPDTNGVKVRAYANTSFDNPIIYGTLHALVHYNGKEFYNNGLDLCTVDKNEKDKSQILSCPISKGMHFIVKEKKVSPFYPQESTR